MLIPIRDDNPTTHRAYVTLAIIALNVAIFVLWQKPWSSQEEQELFAFCHAEIPYEVVVQAMDAIRTDGEKKLFPDVLLSAGVQ